MSVLSKSQLFSMIAGAALAAGALVGSVDRAAAQAAPAPKQPVPVAADPSATTASFGDWLLRCVKAGDGANAKRSCEVVQSIVAEGQQAPLAQLAIGRVQPGNPLRLTLVLPHNVSLTAAPRLSSSEGDKQPTELGWQRCLPMGCFADAAARDEVLAKWRAAGEGRGQIVFADGAGRPVTLPFSLRGLAQALDALSKS